MIIRIIAMALIQCRILTHAGWITFAAADALRWSLAARLDMVVSLAVRDSLYAGKPDCVTALPAIEPIGAGHDVHEKASRVAPARLSRLLMGTGSGRVQCYDRDITRA